MPASSVSANAASRGWSRWRALLAGLVVAGIAAAGLAAAAPAAAEDTPVPASTLEIAVSSCDSYGAKGSLNYVVRDPNAFYRDFIWITDATNAVVHEATYLDGTEFESDVDLDPGTYTIRYSVEHETGAATIDVQTFTIGGCPDLGVAVTPLACSTDRNGEALLTLTGLVPGELYTYSVTGPNFAVGGSLGDEFGETEDIELIGMPPGNYVAYAEQVVPQPEVDAAAVPEPPNFDWVGFAIEPCQPEIAVEVSECAASGGTGAAHFTLANLVAGVEYEVRVTDRGEVDGTPYGEGLTVTGETDGTAMVEASGLSASHEYTVWVDGVWEAEPWEEPPFVGGGGNFTPLETVVLAARTDFTLAPCPAAPAAPAAPTAPIKPATLPATGTDGAGSLFAASMLLLGLGGVLLLARRRMTDLRDLN